MADALPLIVPANLLTKVELIGRGGFGEVYKGLHEHWGPVVIKCIRAGNGVGESNARKLQTEAVTHRSLSHPNIAQLIGLVWQPDNYAIIMELVEHGSLVDFMRKHANLDRHVKLHLVEGVILGTNYLHTRSPPIIHRDLKLANVLISGSLDAKITDFGLSELKAHEEETHHAMAGTITHIPPESWRDRQSVPTEKFDVYSFAILLWELLAESSPFKELDRAKIRESVMNGKRPDETPVSLKLYPNEEETFQMKHMMVCCWNQEPDERPSFTELKATMDQILRDHRVAKKIRDAQGKLQQVIYTPVGTTSVDRGMVPARPALHDPPGVFMPVQLPPLNNLFGSPAFNPMIQVFKPAIPQPVYGIGQPLALHPVQPSHVAQHGGQRAETHQPIQCTSGQDAPAMTGPPGTGSVPNQLTDAVLGSREGRSVGQPQPAYGNHWQNSRPAEVPVTNDHNNLLSASGRHESDDITEIKRRLDNNGHQVEPLSKPVREAANATRSMSDLNLRSDRGVLTDAANCPPITVPPYHVSGQNVSEGLLDLRADASLGPGVQSRPVVSSVTGQSSTENNFYHSDPGVQPSGSCESQTECNWVESEGTSFSLVSNRTQPLVFATPGIRSVDPAHGFMELQGVLRGGALPSEQPSSLNTGAESAAFTSSQQQSQSLQLLSDQGQGQHPPVQAPEIPLGYGRLSPRETQGQPATPQNAGHGQWSGGQVEAGAGGGGSSRHPGPVTIYPDAAPSSSQEGVRNFFQPGITESHVEAGYSPPGRGPKDTGHARYEYPPGATPNEDLEKIRQVAPVKNQKLMGSPIDNMRLVENKGGTVSCINISGANNVIISNSDNIRVNVGRSPHSGAGNSVTHSRNGKPKEVKKLKVPKKQVDRPIIVSIARNLGGKWRLLGRELGFSDAQLDYLKMDYGTDGMEEVIVQMMREWVEREGDLATCRALGKALVAIKRADLVKQFAD